MPEIRNGVPLPVRVSVFDPFILKVCPRATLTLSTLIDPTRSISGLDEPPDIERMPTSCVVGLLSARVFVPVGFKVIVPVPLV